MGKGEDTNDFNKIGPSHLKLVRWTNSYHRTSVAASLVNGVYTLEHDRRENRKGTQSLAEPWWEFFGFTLHKILMDKDSIYGAIFEFKHYKNAAYVNVPHYVIAFRGTILKEDTLMSDMKLNLKIISNSLHRDRRAKDAVEKTLEMVNKHNGSPIWLAGHSSGAALGLLAGKTMKKKYGFNLESYIFNPPIEWTIPSELFPVVPFIKDMFQVGKIVVKNTVLLTLDEIMFEIDDPTLATWIPYLYVNPADPICAGCIDYFKKKASMSMTERISARKSIRNLLFRNNGESSTSDLAKGPLHLLASADIIVNKNKPTNTTGPHDLHQWWEQHSILRQNWESVSIRLEDQERLKQLSE